MVFPSADEIARTAVRDGFPDEAVRGSGSLGCSAADEATLAEGDVALRGQGHAAVRRDFVGREGEYGPLSWKRPRDGRGVIAFAAMGVRLSGDARPVNRNWSQVSDVVAAGEKAGEGAAAT